MPHPPCACVVLTVLLLVSVRPAKTATEQWWHLTDTHLDPYYTEGAFVSGCYCETHDACPRMPSDCTIAPAGAGAGPFGESEADCATPVALWESALEFMADTAPAVTLVLHTGDHGEAGLSASCSAESPAQAQIVGILERSMAGLHAAFPAARIFSVLGNHDGTPGDVFDAGPPEAWLYDNLTSIFGQTFANDSAALATLQTGGYYSTLARPGLRIVALNTNYFTTLNPLLANSSSAASAAGVAQLAWVNDTLAEAAVAGEAVVVIGHIPPHGAWRPGVFSRYRAIMTAHAGTVRAELFGHSHVDETTIVRACTPQGGGGGGNATVMYVVTRGVEWCSGENLDVGDVFGAGLGGGDAWCPLLPGGVTLDAGGHLCEGVCSARGPCAGFTLYPNASGVPGGAQCCFRTVLSNMPRNASSSAVCYARAGGPVPSDGGCASSPVPPPLHLAFTMPSLTEGYPPANAAVRLWTVDPSAWELLDGETFIVNISAANAAGVALFHREYSFRADFNMPDLSPGSWEAVTQRMQADFASPGGAWALFERLYYKNYSSGYPLCATAVCALPEIAYLNGTTGVDT